MAHVRARGLGTMPAMEPRQLVAEWVGLFNTRDADGLAALYAEAAINHQVVREPVEGRDAIRDMFVADFAGADMQCQVQNLFQDGEWAILEWQDPKGLRGCGFFHVVDGLIVFQRGYFNELTFLRQEGLPLPVE